VEIKATDVKALREKTGAGMMDCKKALIQTGGDFAGAVTILKELGLAAAAKRSGKAANEGRIFSAVSGNRAGLLELSCETDFVSRNTDFIAAGEKMALTVVSKGLTEADDEVQSMVDDLRSSIKENINLKRFETIEFDDRSVVVDYLHGEGKIGVLVQVKTNDPSIAANEKVKEFAFDCALHVAAYNPTFLNRDMVDAAYLAEQEAIFRKQAEGLDKPANVIDGIIKGKLNKHLGEVVFLEQGFVKEEKTKVSDMAKRIGKEVGGTIEVSGYRYYRVGEET
jgi:elongation factor Ts